MKMTTPQQYCLRWKHHHSNVQSMFSQLLEKERFCDVTLYCSPSFQGKDAVDQNLRGVSLRAHRVVLAACSELLGSLLGAHESLGEPVLVVDGAEPRHLRALLRYMYTGEMSVHHSQLAGLLRTAEELRIKGLTDIRWNNKDEPPDCNTGNLGITAATPEQKSPVSKIDTQDGRRTYSPEAKRYGSGETKKRGSGEAKAEPRCDPANVSDVFSAELLAYMKREEIDEKDKLSVNGGPPPLIKLPAKEKNSLIIPDRLRPDGYDSESPSPKRRRMISGGTDLTDDDNSRDRDQEWQHGNMDITAERVAAWGASGALAGAGAAGAAGAWSRDASEDEWADAPADIGSFLHTRLRVDGDNSADDDSTDGSVRQSSLRSVPAAPDVKVDLHAAAAAQSKHALGTPTKYNATDPRFADVVKLNDYLQHGRRPQFWEENYVKRVMEAVRLKQLEMKQAAEILGVSYGTLYGRYRDVYGCINRPYRTTRDFWQAKGPSEVLDRLQRGEISLDTASQSLGVTASNLAAYVAEVTSPDKSCIPEFEPIPIEVDPSIKMKTRAALTAQKGRPKHHEKSARKPAVSGTEDADGIPASVIVGDLGGGKWPSIRVASIDTLRAEPASAPAPASASATAPASPSALMRTRPDLTIVAAKRKEDDSS